jgi:hypothetical protein
MGYQKISRQSIAMRRSAIGLLSVKLKNGYKANNSSWSKFMNTKRWYFIGIISGLVAVALIAKPFCFSASLAEHSYLTAFWLAAGLFSIMAPIKSLRSENLNRLAKSWLILWGPSLFIVTEVLHWILLQMAFPVKTLTWVNIFVELLVVFFIFPFFAVYRNTR